MALPARWGVVISRQVVVAALPAVNGVDMRLGDLALPLRRGDAIGLVVALPVHRVDVLIDFRVDRDGRRKGEERGADSQQEGKGDTHYDLDGVIWQAAERVGDK